MTSTDPYADNIAIIGRDRRKQPKTKYMGIFRRNPNGWIPILKGRVLQISRSEHTLERRKANGD